MDFQHPPEKVEREERIKHAAAHAHANKNNAVLVLMPVQYSGQTTQAYINVRRSIEDRLLYHKLSIDSEISIHYAKADRHQNDKRRAACTAFLCVSQTYADTSPWLQNQVFATMDGNIENVPMQRTTDVRSRPKSRSGPDTDVAPVDRQTQRGAGATKTIMEKLFVGQGFDRTHAVVVVDEHPGVGDWTDGAFELQTMYNSGSALPFVAYATTFTGDLAVENLEHEELQSRMQGKYMKTWWEPRAGPAEPSTRPDDEVEKPNLAICTWGSHGLAQIPDMVINRFPDDSPLYKAWADFINSKLEDLAKAQASRSRVTAREKESRKSAPALTDPDFSIDPPQSVLGNPDTIEEIVVGDFPIKDTILGVLSHTH